MYIMLYLIMFLYYIGNCFVSNVSCHVPARSDRIRKNDNRPTDTHADIIN